MQIFISKSQIEESVHVFITLLILLLVTPLNAPRWTKSGYNGSMKAVIKRAISKYNNNSKNSAEEYEENQNDNANKRNDNNDNKKNK